MDNFKSITTLIKFSSFQYISALKKGQMYLNTLGYFINCENKVQQDDMEGIDILHQARHTTSIKIESPRIKPIILSGNTGLINFRAGRDSNLKLNVFCMYLWDVGNHNFSKIDERVLEFGESALIIIRPDEFMKRVKNAIILNNFIFSRKEVEYFDEDTYHGSVGVFKKRKSLKYMREYRIVVQAKMDNKPYVLNIGDISDISISGKSSDINDFEISRL